MIHRERGELICACDECGESHPGGTLEWAEFIADLSCDWFGRAGH